MKEIKNTKHVEAKNALEPQLKKMKEIGKVLKY